MLPPVARELGSPLMLNPVNPTFTASCDVTVSNFGVPCCGELVCCRVSSDLALASFETDGELCNAELSEGDGADVELQDCDREAEALEDGTKY